MNPVSTSHGFVVSKTAFGARTSFGYSENSPALNLGMTEGVCRGLGSPCIKSRLNALSSGCSTAFT
jgi:hypothetical protein